MTLDDLIKKFQELHVLLWQKWPVEDPQKRTFIHTLKSVEEMGELSDAILSSMKLQRSAKLEKFNQEEVAKEWADVTKTLILLGLDLGIDVKKTLLESLDVSFERVQQEDTQKNL